MVNDFYSDQVVIDKGSVNGVYEGQLVISDKGVVGQVVVVVKMISWVLLICDVIYVLLIQVLCNDICVIVVGNGCMDDFQFEYLLVNIDICVGDVLVIFGFGGCFFEGYLVGVVFLVKLDIQCVYIVIQVCLMVGLQCLCYLLLLWGVDCNGVNLMILEEVYWVVNECLMQMMLQVLFVLDVMGLQMLVFVIGLMLFQLLQFVGG